MLLDGGRDGKVVRTKVFAYHPFDPGIPGVADSHDVGHAEAACAPINIYGGTVS